MIGYLTRSPHSPIPRPSTLTLGTVFHQAPGVFEAALAGLRELPLNIVVTTGPGSDPERFGPQPPNVVIELFIPQALILPQCRVVVSHCGAGTMLGALSHGLPQLCLPQDADQSWKAAACSTSAQRAPWCPRRSPARLSRPACTS